MMTIALNSQVGIGNNESLAPEGITKDLWVETTLRQIPAHYEAECCNK